MEKLSDVLMKNMKMKKPDSWAPQSSCGAQVLERLPGQLQGTKGGFSAPQGAQEIMQYLNKDLLKHYERKPQQRRDTEASLDNMTRTASSLNSFEVPGAPCINTLDVLNFLEGGELKSGEFAHELPSCTSQEFSYGVSPTGLSELEALRYRLEIMQDIELHCDSQFRDYQDMVVDASCQKGCIQLTFMSIGDDLLSGDCYFMPTLEAPLQIKAEAELSEDTVLPQYFGDVYERYESGNSPDVTFELAPDIQAHLDGTLTTSIERRFVVPDPLRLCEKISKSLGDPKMTNLAGQNFDLRSVGNFSFLNIANSSNASLLSLHATIEKAGESSGAHAKFSKCATYVTSATLSGEWVIDPVKIKIGRRSITSLRQLAGVLQTKTSGRWINSTQHGHSLDLKGGNTLQMTPKFATLHIKGITITATLRLHHPRSGKQVSSSYFPFFDLQIKGLKALKTKNLHVGGLLGYDDHRAFTFPPSECLPSGVKFEREELNHPVIMSTCAAE